MEKRDERAILECMENLKLRFFFYGTTTWRRNFNSSWLSNRLLFLPPDALSAIFFLLFRFFLSIFTLYWEWGESEGNDPRYGSPKAMLSRGMAFLLLLFFTHHEEYNKLQHNKSLSEIWKTNMKDVNFHDTNEGKFRGHVINE